MNRGLRTWPLALLAALALQALLAAGKDPDPGTARDRVSLLQDGNVFTVTATFDVPHAASVVAAVLTDYEHISRFMPDVTKSVVVERGEGRAVVEQEAVARLMLFSKRVHLLLDVEQEEDVIRFRDRGGRSFSRYDGSWRIATVNGRTTITYELTARPSFDVPDFILGRLLKRDARKMIEGLRREMARRNMANGLTVDDAGAGAAL